MSVQSFIRVAQTDNSFLRGDCYVISHITNVRPQIRHLFLSHTYGKDSKR